MGKNNSISNAHPNHSGIQSQDKIKHLGLTNMQALHTAAVMTKVCAKVVHEHLAFQGAIMLRGYHALRLHPAGLSGLRVSRQVSTRNLMISDAVWAGKKQGVVGEVNASSKTLH